MNQSDLNFYRPQLVETVSGKWVRVPHDFEKRTCLIELPHGMLIHVQASCGIVELYSVDPEGYYVKTGAIDLFAQFRTSGHSRLEQLPNGG
ncbi:hypothetical protein ACFQWB_10610 [Paenibacillus thermoaerophilus]|uniref:Uncharacterized protein n=1 Tax=Paenibacillus thermoaerophilus TaxID=1215385 RepID=A0ABW2V564_9BACL|nr:hypothetical protein [Paenibacillus thermoaerophilus]TMV18776.1 hypothetical protein FE781_02280 [Paenibacillus thermoaerophilus]